MPAKLSAADITPTVVQERLDMWGLSIRAARLQRRITAANLCESVGISETTLRRLERGDAGASAGTYLMVLFALGLLEKAVPPLPASLLQARGQRVRLGKSQGESKDDEHF